MLALALAQNGFRVVVLEQAEQLEETGAGIQLSPNAARILINLGLEDRLRQLATAPVALRVLSAANGREIVRMPLADAEQRYGAPYWVTHRGDLQAALAWLPPGSATSASSFLVYAPKTLSLMPTAQPSWRVAAAARRRNAAWRFSPPTACGRRRASASAMSRPLASPAGPPGAVWSRHAWSHPNFASR